MFLYLISAASMHVLVTMMYQAQVAYLRIF